MDPLLPAEQAGIWRGRSTVDQAVLLTHGIDKCFEEKKGRCRVRRSNIVILSALWSHLQAAETPAWQTHGTNDHGACLKQELYPHYRKQKTKQFAKLEEWPPTGISRSPLLIKHTCLRSTTPHTCLRSTTPREKFSYAVDLGCLHTSNN